MPVKKSEVRKAAGKLVSAIQKEWGDAVGEPEATESEDVMHHSHVLLGANSPNELAVILKGKSIAEYLGVLWVKAHPAVLPYIKKLEEAQ